VGRTQEDCEGERVELQIEGLFEKRGLSGSDEILDNVVRMDIHQSRGRQRFK
jgi:hypothetical protein